MITIYIMSTVHKRYLYTSYYTNQCNCPDIILDINVINVLTTISGIPFSLSNECVYV